ncbi:chloride channel protein [Rhodospirillum rubrum]|uniref:Cl-channel, voltage gated n=1 Tax=Rhodospirillum rubrum (strain ATCC 11170 / ATH 1.1.1 / DSM 467 / LMG 4362 / NCIMB 8255 / S1) TaxID=269796 RepID=Q2RU61_RHORT|nr:chloride channel protein [Rhodospirillum rubrum]ABC22334.1 Cl- channel, voltage gated [Rhodospirillum rubrum ATCC 11170]AEO48050.1 Cl- channel, voltage gated [Rhodospirillum rubrum F11]MBK5953914.1 chloride channel protein [Rhodospirillum rubrum]QXG81974.1 chloride channel protein [Rhodospirillum rubrum]HCF16861.1 chloride channel protein [Rhodospirillum rubrum]
MQLNSPGVLFRLRRLLRTQSLVLGALAVGIGLLVGAGTVAFREAIDLVQTLFYGGDDLYLARLARSLPGWLVVLGPTAGGLLVGLYYAKVMPGGKPQGVAQVIGAVARTGGRMRAGDGVLAACGSALSLGCGASVGREGPAVHLGAALAAGLAGRLRLGPGLARTVLGCGVAAAVAASFNAPIAGALFAGEVVIGHYALSAFAPIVVSSVVATVLSRGWFGDFPAFILPHLTLASAWEFPAFVVLGGLCGLVAVAFMRGVFLAGGLASALRLPVVLRPMVAGALVGLLALVLPEVLGVGYEATDQVLKGAYHLDLLLPLILAKLAASVICLGFGFGGGVFSPSLTLGALVGGAFGLAIALVAPVSASGAYALIGMGALSAAVLGAPISTTLIVFELTGDYALSVGTMVAAVVAGALSRQICGHLSFFRWQLAKQGIDLEVPKAEGVLRVLRIGDLTWSAPPQRPAGGAALVSVTAEETLAVALARLRQSGAEGLVVVDDQGRPIGGLRETDLAWACVRALDEAEGDR